MFRGFMVMFVKSGLWSIEKMRYIAKFCVILHNMIVEKRRGEYTSDGVSGFLRNTILCQSKQTSL
jgi:hypothetical protein